MSSSLHTLRNKFFVGDYKAVISIIEVGKFGNDVKEEIETIKYRSLLNTNKIQQILDDIPSSEEQPHLKAIRILGEYVLPSSTDDFRKSILEKLNREENIVRNSQSPVFRIVQSTILTSEDDLEKAYKVLTLIPTETLEMFNLVMLF
jgi:hypothetical protein